MNASTLPSTAKPRLMSLDFLRGLTVASMILVNNPGDWGHVYPPLEHSKWNGCTPTDLIFPFFLFMVGVSIVYAMGTRKEDPAQHRSILLHAFRRMCLIFGLGLLLTLIPHFNFTNLRIPGVLQRIAVVFMICTILFLKTTRRTQIITLGVLLVGYYLTMTLIPVPGVGEANLEPGTNLAAWLDYSIFTPAHMWSGTKTWDPEGILSTIPAVGTGIMGMLTGTWLRRKDREDGVKISWLFVYGFGAVIAGLIWDSFFPINKALWSSSFVLFVGGLACMTLGLCYWLIDVNKRQRFITPFVAFGRNAITAYVLADFVPEIMGAITFTEDGKPTNLYGSMYNHLFTSWLSPFNASLGAAIFLVLLLLIPMWIMYRKNIIVKI